ncbi:metallophosphoesterase family protein [Desulfogranum mediterraneum]|uniref:metallophosphoesterase family protein n=1 Tax=Desulfogranum mediterraneum TaxID=160661 RepID=UPI0003F62220|nr:metallophosphoesterase family protein [Desulfogranum mediterraneum]
MEPSINRTIVIGDIHGCLESLNTLLEQLSDRADTFIFLGDYVDRGPCSREVVERILRLRREHPRVITLQGNHDLMFLHFLEGRDPSMFLRFGGSQTLASYQLQARTAGPAEAIPPDHLHFFRSLPLYYEDQHALYVHAGLQPGCHLSLQRAEWCLWAREEFLATSFDFGKPVIFGHTPFDRPLLAANKIGIDTGAVYGGTLTALLLPERQFISVPGERRAPYEER